MICDEMDFGSPIAAERLSIPHATVPVIASGKLVLSGRLGRNEVDSRPSEPGRKVCKLPHPALAGQLRDLTGAYVHVSMDPLGSASCSDFHPIPTGCRVKPGATQMISLVASTPETTRPEPFRPWNLGKLMGQKPPLKLREVWAIRIRL